jgi:MSHA biogenesis protein MshL
VLALSETLTMRRGIAVAMLAALACGCAPAPVVPVKAAQPAEASAKPSPAPLKPVAVDPRILRDLDRAVTQVPGAPDAALVQDALLPPLRADIPGLGARAMEKRFDIAVTNAPASQVFMTVGSGTRYSMLLHPDLGGNVTLSLKDTTVREALDALRELYGYEYRIEGTRIFVQPAGVQTRIFRVNYTLAQRLGRSDIRVPSSLGSDAGAPRDTSAPDPGPADSSRIQTAARNDFWEALRSTLSQIVGSEGGRSVVVNSQASVVVVRAMPAELRNVEGYLKEIRLSVERQVMLEAKIVEVTLSEHSQAGVNWALLPSPRRVTSETLIPGVPGGSLVGVAFRTQDFDSVLGFLESQGGVQVLSSPRIATMNNQKAVLKVGTDAFFVTSIAGGSAGASAAGGTTHFPTLGLRPFFSGVALDVMPQIDDESSIILHIHPSVSKVTQDDRDVNLGSVFGGSISLPFARSSVSETDSIVRVRNGDIVAIGGLMKLERADDRSRGAGPGQAGTTRGERNELVKKELVILVKATVMQSDGDWREDARDARDRLLNMGAPGAGPAR